MLTKLKNVFLYAGVDRLSYERARPKILKANLIMATVISALAAFLISILLISSFKSESIQQNRIVYELGLIMSLVILLASLTVTRRHPKIIMVIVYASYSIYYLYGILIGAITDPAGKTVTFMVMLVFMPILFIDRPLHILLVTTGYVIIFVALCLKTKVGAVLSIDSMDAVIFGVLGIVSGSVINHMKVKGYILEQRLQEISRIDQLTQMRNRNAYEFELDSIPELCKHSLGCLYIDVNGLHEINNEKGHEFGDKMLKRIATEIKYAFTDELSYRIGGDEFIAFIPDITEEELEKKIFEMIEKIEAENYHVATGYEVASIRHLSMYSLTKSAEAKMFRDKKRYYKDIANRDVRNKN